MYVGILSPVESAMSLFSSHAFIKGLGATEISVGHGVLGFHYQNCHWFSLLPTFLPLLVVPPLQSILRYWNSLHPKGSLTALHCTLKARFLHTLLVTTLSCCVTRSSSLGFIRVRDTPDTANTLVGAAPHWKSIISH